MQIELLKNQIIKKHPRASIAILIGFFLLIAWLMDNKNTAIQQNTETTSHESVDTYIPNGFVLIPITVQNPASLDSMVGQFAVVDLYSENESSPLGVGLKLIRSPNDPSQFAVLAPENRAHVIIRANAKALQVIVQNPNQAKSQIRNTKAANHILWEN